MKHTSISATGKHARLIAFALTIVLYGAPQARAQTFSVIYSFTGGSDGGYPLAGFVIGPKGELFGTASVGGSFQAGVVFKISETGGEKVLYSFTGGVDGANPNSSLIFDASGDLYGTTYAGGAYGAGTVFEVTQAGEETVLYNFTGGADGANPMSKLIFDTAGNLYGTTSAGGAYGGGTVFEVVKGGTEAVLHSFGNGTDGANLVAGVTLLENVDKVVTAIFGATSAGGTNGDGTVFVLRPSQSGWKESVLHNFENQSDGGTPYAGLVFDHSGNLYGTTTAGGGGNDNSNDGGGTVFELTYSNDEWNFSVLDGLSGSGVSGTYRNVILDASGNIYATTHCDGEYGSGTVYELTPSGGTWTYNALYAFTGGDDGLYSYSNLVFDAQGNLYGTTKAGGTAGYGVVFKVTP
jgi:uncharacterized repeat protein (TIGR03803 family)